MWYVWWIWEVGGRTPKHDRGVGGLAERAPGVRKEEATLVFVVSVAGLRERYRLRCAA